MRVKRQAMFGAFALVLACGAVPAASGAGGGNGGGSGAHRTPPGLNVVLKGAALGRPGEEGGDEDSGTELRERAEFAQSIQSAPARSIPVAGVLAAQRRAAAMPVRGGRWTSPTDKPFVNDPIPRGGPDNFWSNYGVGHGVVTGRMTALTTSRGLVYAGSASGGVYRSSDRGRHWHAVNRGLPRLSVGALATDPRDGSVWIGTGEANNASENQYGTGVYRLARGSSKWVRVGGRELYGAGAYRIAWIRGYVYVATNHGLYRRAVGAGRARAWRPVLQPHGPKAYPPSSAVTSVIPVPGSHGRRVLAVVGWTGYSDPPETDADGFYVGRGGSGSFHRITPTGDIDAASIGRTTFTSSHRRLYAVVASSSPDPDANGTLKGEGVFRSDQGPRGPWVRVPAFSPIQLRSKVSSGE